MVYVTDAYGFYFADSNDDEGRRLVIEIDVDRLNPDLIYPDEDALTVGLSQKKIDQVHYENLANLEKHKDEWQKHLAVFGSSCLSRHNSTRGNYKICAN